MISPPVWTGNKYDFGLMENAELLAALRQEDVEFTTRLQEENNHFSNEKISSFIQGGNSIKNSYF